METDKTQKRNSWMTPERIEEEHLNELNARLYYLMLKTYDEVAEAKECIDRLIANGADYYKNYLIVGEIFFAPEEEVKLPNGEWVEPTCTFRIKAEYRKKMTDKFTALSLDKNFSKDEFLPLRKYDTYVCRATWEFIHPQDYHDRFVPEGMPFEIFKKAKQDDFGSCVNVHITKDKSRHELVDGDCYDWTHEYPADSLYENAMEKGVLPKKYVRKFRKMAQTILKWEVEAAATKKKMRRDFAMLEKEGYKIFKGTTFNIGLNYNAKKLFGEKSYDDKMMELAVNFDLDQTLDVEVERTSKFICNGLGDIFEWPNRIPELHEFFTPFMLESLMHFLPVRNLKALFKFNPRRLVPYYFLELHDIPDEEDESKK